MSTVLKNLTSKDNGTEVKLRVGDQLALQLYESGSTGYRWAFENLDEKLVAVRKDEAISPSSSRRIRAMGEAPVQWILAAKTAGRTEIKLKRWQRWRGEASVQERFAVTLIISAAKRRTRHDAHP